MIADVPQPVHPNPQPVAHEARCHTHRCWRHVSERRHEDWAWRFYKRHPMPRCTWDGESAARGASISAYSPVRYHARNRTSTAGGKYQILYSTWLAMGGPAVGNAANAAPLTQEKIARVVLARQGIYAWVGC